MARRGEKAEQLRPVIFSPRPDNFGTSGDVAGLSVLGVSRFLVENSRFRKDVSVSKRVRLILTETDGSAL